ncbi:PAS domain S-box protein [Halosimplex halophilum]|uniref:PAS domain S-box protein n=1 Tax=Halosimplex halophilum TaxID=2559572 RepID=UPI00107F4CD1|nr:PAS domain S-box protein [Halosimplex halophilum]
MDAGSTRDPGPGRAVADRGNRTPTAVNGRDRGPPDTRGRAPVALVAAALAALVACLAVEGLPSAQSLGPLGGLAGTGLLGLAASGDGDDGVAELVDDIERARDGEDVSFDTDREDGLGELAAAVEGLVDDLRECERERRLQERVIESAPVGVAVADATEPDNPLVAVNERFEELTGYEESECLGRNCRFLQGEDTDEERVAQFREAIDAEEEVTVELRNYRADGTEFWNRVRLAPVEDADGEVTHYVGFQEDVTDRVERRAELAREKSLLDSIFEQVPIHLYVKDREGRYERVSSAYVEGTYGWDPDRLVGRTDPELFDDELAAESHADDLRVVETGEAIVGKEEYVPDVDEWNLTTKVPWRGPDGEVRGLFGVSQKVTERKERERELAEYREFTDDILDAIDDVFYVLDDDGDLLRWNETLAEVTGYDDSEIADMQATDFVVEADREAVRNGIANIEELAGVPLEARFETSDGEAVPFEIVASPLENPDGERIIAGVARDISERKEHERRLTAVVENTEDPIYIKDRDGRYRFVNEAFASYFGESPAAITGATDGELFDEVTAEDIRGDDRRVLDDGEHVSREVTRPVDGENRVFLDHKYPYRDEDGAVAGVMGISRDITERKAAEEKLRERERRLQEYREYTEEILDAIDDVFYVLSAEGGLQRWNGSLRAVTGYDDSEIADMHATDFFAEDDRPRIAAAIETALRSGDTRVEAPFLTADGEAVPFEFVASRLESPDGEPVVVGIGRDISERKERERELRATKERMQKFVETSPVGVVATDPEGRVTLWNDAMEAIFGWSAEEVLGEPYPAVPADREGDDEVRQRVLAGESVTGVERERVRKDGERIDVSLSTAPVRDDDGEVEEVVGYIEDITERKERERELAARSAAMEQSIDGMAILDEDGRYEFVNRAHAEVYGYDDPGAFLGERWELCYEDAEVDRLEREVLPVLAEAGDWRGEAVGRRADGSTFPQELSLTVLDDGRQVCVVRDITERKARERELERTRDLLQQAGRIASIGGWELDLTGDDPEMTWTDELYRLHGVSPDTDIDLETAVEFYHPDDREQIREYFRRAVEVGESYDMEVRLGTDESVRWVRAIGEPVREDGEVVRVRGSIQDITEQKERELALESLHEATRGLLGVETDEETAELVVETARSVLDVAGVAVYLLDDSANRLDAVACSEGFERLCDADPVRAGTADSLLWNTYVTGTPTVFDDTGTVAESAVFGPAVSGGLLVPVGDHGVFVVATEERAVGGATRQLAETLVATTEAAFDRLASERTLRERDAELAEQNARLRRQIGITDLIRRIDQSLIQAESREAIESAVCDRLVESDDVAFAWIGGLDAAGNAVEPSAWAGDGAEYLDAVDLATGGSATEPAVRTAVDETPTVVGNVVDDLQREDWRKAALAREFHSVVSVPLAFEEYFYGVLTVYASEPDDFGDLEREVFAELGENIAHSINAVETQRALHTDQRVELSLSFDADDDVLGRLARTADCRVAFEGLAAHSDAETGLFLTTAGAPVEAVTDALDDLVSVREFRLVGEPETAGDADTDGGTGEALFEVTVEGDALAAEFVRHGARPRSIRADPGGLEAVVDVSTATDVRAFVEMLGETYPSVELASRRTVDRSGEDDRRTGSAFDALTDRQLEVLRTAYYAGFFEWPRTSTGEDVAEMLGVSQPTVNRHLRVGQQRLLERLFEDHTVAGTGAD